jgi:adenosylmethionine-8-amino-7-oxononanoate aminotransferase
MPNTPSTADLIAWDRQYVWHPFTPMKAWMEKNDPVVIERGEGDFLIDTEGRRYIDGVASMWCNVHGHCVPELDAALHAQASKIAHTTLLGLINVPSVQLAKRLIELAPKGLTKVFYSDNGSTAVEIACKMAYQYWANRGMPGKSRFIAFANSYHGDTLGAVSIGGIPTFHEAYRPLCFPVDFVPSITNDQSPITNLLAARPNQHAAIVVEPMVQGAGGIIMHPPGLLRELRRLADKHNVLLIADEVLTGFGRTGKMFACEHEGVTPDLMCLSKGLTAGYMPLGATLTTQDVFAAFYADPREGKTFFHGHTFTGHPLACAVALASLELFEKNRLLQHVHQMSQLMQEALAPAKEMPFVGDVRSLGLLAAVEIVRDKATGKSFPYHWRLGGALCTAMRSHGVMLRPLADHIVLCPPLAIKEENLRRLCKVVLESLELLPSIIGQKRSEFGHESVQR